MSEPCTLTRGNRLFSSIMEIATVAIVVSSIGPDLIQAIGNFLSGCQGTTREKPGRKRGTGVLPQSSIPYLKASRRRTTAGHSFSTLNASLSNLTISSRRMSIVRVRSCWYTLRHAPGTQGLHEMWRPLGPRFSWGANA